MMFSIVLFSQKQRFDIHVYLTIEMSDSILVIVIYTRCAVAAVGKICVQKICRVGLSEVNAPHGRNLVNFIVFHQIKNNTLQVNLFLPVDCDDLGFLKDPLCCFTQTKCDEGKIFFDWILSDSLSCVDVVCHGNSLWIIHNSEF